MKSVSTILLAFGLAFIGVPLTNQSAQGSVRTASNGTRVHFTPTNSHYLGFSIKLQEGWTVTKSAIPQAYNDELRGPTGKVPDIACASDGNHRLEKAILADPNNPWGHRSTHPKEFRKIDFSGWHGYMAVLSAPAKGARKGVTAVAAYLANQNKLIVFGVIYDSDISVSQVQSLERMLRSIEVD